MVTLILGGALFWVWVCTLLFILLLDNDVFPDTICFLVSAFVLFLPLTIYIDWSM